MLLLVDYALLAANVLLLLLEGASDRKFHGIPYTLVVAHVILAAVATATRYSYLDQATFALVYATTGTLVAVLAALHVFTGLIGEGDVVVMASSSAVTPYVSLGYLSGVPLLAPLAVAVSSAYLFYRYSLTTRAVYLKGVGRVRARVRYAVDFKRGLLRGEVPVYIDGYGAIPVKARKNPGRLEKLLAGVPDYAIVYAVPNYPYIYYYSVAFVTVYLLLALISVLVDLVVF